MYLVKVRETKREGETERRGGRGKKRPSIQWLIPQMTATAGLGQVEARTQELHLDLLHRWQRPTHLGHLLLPSQMRSRGG